MTVRGFVLYWGLCWCGGVLVCPSVLYGQQPSPSVRAGKRDMAHVLPQHPMVREIYVPEEQFSVLLGAAPEHVFLPRYEYEQLLRHAAQKPAQEAPARVLLTDAEYRIRMEDGRATIEGQLAIEVLEPHWHALPLVFRGVGLHEAFWDGQPAPLVRDTQAQVQLLVSQTGQHSLRVGMTAPVAVQAAQQTLQIQVPAAPSTRVQLVARGNVEVKSGAKVLRRTYDAQRDETDFDLVAEPGVWNFVLSLNNRLLQKERLIVARSVIADHLMRGREFVQISTSMHVLHGAVEELRLYIPANLEVQSVESDWLARWQLTAREDGRRELLIGLRTAVTDTVSLIVHAERKLDIDTRWQLPHIEWAEVSGSTAVLAVIAEIPLELAQLDAQHVIALDAELAKRFVATDSELPPGTDVRPLMAFYAPGSHYQVTADVRLPVPYWNVLTSVLLQLSRQETKATGVFTLRAQNERLFEFSFVAPQRWTVTEARDEKQERLLFEVFPQEDGRSRVVVRFNRAVVPGETYTVMFDSAAQLPGWLEEWESQQIQFPVFVAERTASNQGALAVVASEELEVWPEVLENLSPLDRTERQRFGVVPEAPIALLFDAPGYRATMRVERRRPKVTAQTYSFFHLSQGRLTAHYEIRYLVRQATTRQLTAVLPRHTPTELVVRGARGTSVVEFRATETDSDRLWHVVLADNVPLDPATGTGEAHLIFEFQMPISENSEPMQLPLIRAADVGSQSGYFAIEATPERQVTIDTAARRVDPGELSEAEYQPGPTLIGAFSFANVVPVVSVQAEPRTLHDLPAAVVEHAALASILSAHGVVQTQARLSLKTKLTWLELKLPDASAQLLAVVVDGIPVMPRRHEQSLLIPLPLGTESLSRTLVVTYEHQVPRLSWRTLCDLQPPVLLLPSSQAEQQGGAIPVADLNWKVLLPAGYTATWVDEGFEWRYAPRPSIAHRLWETVSGAFVLDARYAAPHLAIRAFPTSPMAVEAMLEPPARMELKDEGANTEMPQLSDRFSAGIGEQDTSHGSIVAAAPVTVPGRPSPANGIDVSKVPEDQKQQAATEAPARTTQLLGVRSLDIDLLQALRETPAERLVEVANMGGQKELRLMLWNDTRSGYLAYAVGLAVIVLGWRARRSLRSGARYLVGVLSLSLVVPAALGWTHELERIRDSCHLGCAFLAVLYLGTAYRRWRTTWFTTRPAAAKRRRSASQSVGIMALFLGWVVLGWQAAPLLGQSPMRPNDLVEELQRLLLAPPLHIPEDAIVIPYDASDPPGLRLEGAQRVLVPYKKYVELLNRAHPDTPLDKLRPIYAYALGPAQFETTLSDERQLHVRGTGQILLLQAQPIGIVLPFAGGVLVQAMLDGQPATIQVDAPQHLVQNAPEVAPGQLTLHVDRPGWHSWQMEFSFPVEKNGGWRVVRGVLPTHAAASLRVTIPDPATEVQILGAADRERWLSNTADYRLRTSVAEGGKLHLQWRPQVGGATIDHTITVQSDSVVDVLEDGMKLAWKGVIQLRGGTRDTFSLLLPGEYVVESVAGPNVRGWRQEADGDRIRLHVTLLRAASEQEELQLYLSRRWSLLENRQATFTAPVIQVEDASREQGTVAIRSSPSVELQALSDRGITRVDIDNLAAEELVRTIGQEERLLPMRPFQTVRFPRLPFHWEAVARLQQALFSTQLQAILRTSERQLRWECRVVVQHRGLPLNMLNVQLPKTLHVENVSVPEWVVSSHGERQQLSLYFSTGKMGRFVVDLAGTAGQRTEEQPVEIPVITVPGAERQESQWVVQVDPAYRLQVEDLVQGQVVPLEQTFSWLRPEQRQAAARGLAIAFRSADYRGILSLSRRKPVVRYTTLTNVNFTPHAVEETVLIELRITEAGIPGVSFTLPARLADARFHIPSLRRKTITPVAPDMLDQEPRVLVHVEFQDELMGTLRLVIEQDSGLVDQPYSVAIPRLLLGEADRQYVTVQNTGRDEVVVLEHEGLEQLTHQERNWPPLAELQANQQFVVQPEAPRTRLVLQPQPRPAVATVTARIGYADTLLSVDEAGVYRAKHQIRIENRTEPFLEIELPPGAQLWAAQVAGLPVKPIQPPQDASGSRIRIPLIKTEEGDADYAVVLIYAGKMSLPANGQQVKFPLLRTVNIRTDVHQVTLYLPDSRRWFDFRGAALLSGAEEYASGYTSYVSDMVGRLAKAKVGAAYKKKRALKGLLQLQEEITKGEFRGLTAPQAADLEQKIQQVQQTINSPLEPISQTEAADAANRLRLQSLFEGQVSVRAKNTVTSNALNFLEQFEEAGTAIRDQLWTINENWLRHYASLAPASPPHEPSRTVQQRTLAGQMPADAQEQWRKLNTALQTEALRALSERSSSSARVSGTTLTRSSAGSTAPAPEPQDAREPLRDGEQTTASQQPRDLTALADQSQQAWLQDRLATRPGYASLDMEVPARGRVYYLRGERGRLEITARSLHQRQQDRWLRVIAGGLVGGFLWWFLRPRKPVGRSVIPRT